MLLARRLPRERIKRHGNETDDPTRRYPPTILLLAVLGAAFLVFVGFAQSYFLKGFFGTPSLYPLLHLHGFIMTSWFLLFGIQTWLVESEESTCIAA